MPRKSRIPSLRRHRTWGLAVDTLNGKDHYLGKWLADQPEAPPDVREAYDRLIAAWLANGRLPSLPPAATTSTACPASVQVLPVEELLLRYWRYAQTYYVKNGAPTSELDTIRQALLFLRKLYASTPAADFSPLAVKAVRQAMIDHPITHKVKVKDPITGAVRFEVRVLRHGLSRRHISKQMGRIKRVFAWAVENELIPPDVHRALSHVKGLRKDKTAAREKATVKPVHDADVQAVVPILPPMVRTMVLVQRLCGGRPQDVVEMKPGDIDQCGPVWEYRPGRHKNEHHERERVIFLGPKAQALLKPYLVGIGPDEYVFSPQRAEAARLAEIRRRRGQPLTKPEKDRGKWAVRDHYDKDSYRRAVRQACKKVGIPIWCPLQLRHAAGTMVRKNYGLEASQAVLGHAELGVTQVYAEVDRDVARRVMTEIG